MGGGVKLFRAPNTLNMNFWEISTPLVSYVIDIIFSRRHTSLIFNITYYNRLELLDLYHIFIYFDVTIASDTIEVAIIYRTFNTKNLK